MKIIKKVLAISILDQLNGLGEKIKQILAVAKDPEFTTTAFANEQQVEEYIRQRLNSTDRDELRSVANPRTQHLIPAKDPDSERPPEKK